MLPDNETKTSEITAPHAPESAPASRRSARIRWARLLARIYEVLPLLCPSCGGQMRILAFLTDPPVVRSILLHLDLGPPRNACIAWGEGLPDRPPPVAPARGPPQGDFLLDQSPAFDLTEPDPVPELDFDQSLPEFDFDQSLPDPFDG